MREQELFLNVISVGLDWSLLYSSVTIASVDCISKQFLTLSYFEAVPVPRAGTCISIAALSMRSTWAGVSAAGSVPAGAFGALQPLARQAGALLASAGQVQPGPQPRWA